MNKVGQGNEEKEWVILATSSVARAGSLGIFSVVAFAESAEVHGWRERGDSGYFPW